MCSFENPDNPKLIYKEIKRSLYVQRFVLRFTSSPSSGEYSYVVASSGVQTPRGRRNRRVHCEIFSTLEICILMGRHQQTSSAPKTIAKCKYQQMSKSFRYLFDSNSNSNTNVASKWVNKGWRRCRWGWRCHMEVENMGGDTMLPWRPRRLPDERLTQSSGFGPANAFWSVDLVSN